ncbi:hypothetical protein [Caballeronia sp. TF1N1]|uniref:hypothetical protein n=1 Tax=Caballeronia sp. TF1N1 TaxID=2878153 RepID=UPI001FD16D88|nr:hypothetical protein [Caballeronia sp. TF1N1]
MSTKHTRGPWMVLPDEDDKPYVRIRGSLAGTRFKIANVLKPIYKDPPEWEAEETLANVRLIETAPDLLAVAREALHVIRVIKPPRNGNGTIVRLEEAIFKATGEKA